jgi:hypothetical protein
MNHWQDTENHMVEPHAEPDDPTPDHDEDEAYEKQRQQDIDLEREKRAKPHYVPDHAKEIADYWLKAFDDIFKDEKLRTPIPTTERKGKF